MIGARGRNARLVLFFAVSPFFCMVFSMTLGQYHIPARDVCRILVGQLLPIEHDWSSVAEGLLIYVRMPRILGAMLIGAGLASSGAAFQGLFRNPLASPYTLGVSNGAGFGASLAILFASTAHAVFLTALFFGLAAVALAFALSAGSKNSTIVLVLSGVIVGAFFAALVSLLKYVADPLEKLPTIVFWLMGSLATVKGSLLLSALPLYLPGIVVLLLYRWRLNLLTLGDEEAASFGVNVRRDRLVVILCCTLITASAVGVAGIVGWVGLVIPHLGRILVGPDFRKLLPVCISLGASYLLLIDDLCRSAFSAEIPLGVVTALIGTPIFAYFMLRQRVNW